MSQAICKYHVEGKSCPFFLTTGCKFMHPKVTVAAQLNTSKGGKTATTPSAKSEKKTIKKNKQKKLERSDIKTHLLKMGVLISRLAKIRKASAEWKERQKDLKAKYGSPTDSKDQKVVKLSWAELSEDQDPWETAEKLLLDKEVAELRNTVRSIMGKNFKVFKITLTEDIYLTSNSGGVLLGNVPIDPTTLNDFKSCAEIFDEFKVTGGCYKFETTDWKPVSSTPANTINILAYDASDNTSVAGLTEAASAQQHIVWYSPHTFAGITGVMVPPCKYEFEYKVPPDALVNAGMTASDGVGSVWQPTTPTNGFVPYGFFKMYGAFFHNSSQVAAGMHYIHCEFRMRE